MKGFGKTDGEATERLWSDLGPYARTTKEMLSGNRQDLLEDALLNAWRRCSKGLMSKLRTDLKRLQKEIPDISLRMCATKISFQDYEGLKKIEKESLLAPRATTPLIQLNASLQSIVCEIRRIQNDLTFSNSQPTGISNVYHVKDLLQKLKAKLQCVLFRLIERG